MRYPLAVAFVLALSAASSADRLITIPLARKIPYRMFKIDGFAELSRGRTWDRFFGVGITPDIEIDYHGERIADGPIRDTFDISYMYLAPIINQTPGIGVGVQDALNRTRDGRRIYLATTWREAVDNIGNGNLPLDTTLGIVQGRHLMPFVGVSLPLSENLRFLVEHNGIRLASGFELRAFNDALGIRVITRDSDVLVGANLRLRF